MRSTKLINIILLIIFIFLITSFLTKNSMKPEDFKNTKPLMTIEKYFEGPVKAWGLLQDRKGKVTRQFKADMYGSFENDILTLNNEVKTNKSEILVLNQMIE